MYLMSGAEQVIVGPEVSSGHGAEDVEVSVDLGVVAKLMGKLQYTVCASSVCLLLSFYSLTLFGLAYILLF